MILSVVTINRNNAFGLQKTMESVLRQTYNDFEYIVIDGASTDNSVDIMNEYTERIINEGIPVHAISEPDTGIYNAMNKGVSMARGEYLLMLNSGDFFLDDKVLNSVSCFLDGTDIIQGNTIQQYIDGTYRCRGYGRSDISFADAVEANFLHQASFIKRTLHEQYGLYDESYQRSADSYFYITCLALGNATFKYIDVDVTNFNTNGITSQMDGYWKDIEKEEDSRWFGEHLSKRMVEEVRRCREIRGVYDSLQSSSLLRKIVFALIKFNTIFNPRQQYVKMDKILF